MYQALFMSATSVGRMLGSFWVGYASEHYGDCAIWLVVAGGFILLWVILLPIYGGEFRPPPRGRRSLRVVQIAHPLQTP
jgi:predicted MFS family arabinose efflux permease